MKVLITGGAGFIGSHLADACMEEGDSVVVLDDLSTGKVDNIAHLLGNPKFRFIEGSITDPAAVERAVADCDAVYHVAAAVGMRLVVSSPLHTFRTNVGGTQIVLDAAAAHERRVLVISTSELYGLNERRPVTEEDLCVLGLTEKRRWNYAYTKAAAEVLAMAYHQDRGLPVVIARLFNTVGPRQSGRYGMVIPTFVTQALSGEPLTVHGDGSQTRCFGDVHEIVRGLAALMRHPGSSGQIFNLGCDREISILELAQRVLALTSSPSRIEFVAHDDVYGPGFDEIMRRRPSTAKARALIAFNPQTDIDEILHGVIAERKQRLAAI
jgi:UDP-glucose 4-epimerase